MAALERAVLAQVQFRRDASYLRGKLTTQVAEALPAFDTQQQEQAYALAMLLDTDPRNAAVGLSRLAYGCRWLLRNWGGCSATSRPTATSWPPRTATSPCG